MTDYSELKAAAEAATGLAPHECDHCSYAVASRDFHRAANPAAVLALLADLDAARKADARYEALAETWRAEQAEYPIATTPRAEAAAAAVRLCARELDAARTGAGDG